MKQILYGQGSLPEGYKMTTYKVMLGLLWTSTKCSPATKFIVKIDDNSVVDLNLLESALEKVDEGSEDNIFCPYQMRGLPVWRHTEAKLQKSKINWRSQISGRKIFFSSSFYTCGNLDRNLSQIFSAPAIFFCFFWNTLCQPEIQDKKMQICLLLLFAT